MVRCPKCNHIQFMNISYENDSSIIICPKCNSRLEFKDSKIWLITLICAVLSIFHLWVICPYLTVGINNDFLEFGIFIGGVFLIIIIAFLISHRFVNWDIVDE